ncbi:UDP-D-xylose:L-fucose alpha-1,3-D-xylosyltransferase 3-like [Lytechinus variegatus]|uniref:UDP-D-xylose:L-fucose alpha-1,3-D-xylosyltransferase 3-like n=1 Tax=Lytechinus variegatus TaxID=7654 RepID=UPI001BB228C0|nr:UDP-D-xylose:L-fucose alpha-1,3-D-xylosyltransferase 3-like [Lytechinus variegatus]
MAEEKNGRDINDSDDLRKRNSSSAYDRSAIILATTNTAFLDFTENWLESLKRVNITDHVNIIAEDKSAYEELSKRSDIKLKIFLTNETNVPATFLRFGTEKYIQMVNKRPMYVLSYLRKGIDVLFSDVDTVWLQNPMPFFYGEYDIHIGRDVYEKERNDVCAGFVYYSATNAAINLVVKWIDLIQAKPKINDQILLNQLFKNKYIRTALKVNYLDQRKFVNGKDYFNPEWRMKNSNIKPVVVHNNWIIGHDIKIQRFKNVSMWYLQ